MIRRRVDRSDHIGDLTILTIMRSYSNIVNGGVIHSNTMLNAAAAAAAKSLQSCLTLCNRIDGNLPGFPAPGILQARTLEWVTISFSNVRK